MATAIERTNIIKLVTTMFNAAPGATYLADFVTFFDATGGTSAQKLTALSNALASTSAYRSANPSFQIDTEFAASLLTPFGLQANADAIAFVTARFNAGMSKGQISAEAMTAIDTSTSTAADVVAAKAILVNKAAVGEYYSVTKATPGTSLAALQAVVANVTAAAASVTTANAAVDVITTPAPGLFTLTTGIDSGTLFVGGSGADVFNATHLTFNASDVLVGGAGIDTLNIVDTGTTPLTLPSATVSGIENINIRNLNSSAVAGVSAVAQVTTVTVGSIPNSASDTVVVNFGSLTQSVATGATISTATTAITSALNALAGATIAVGVTATGVITVTAPTAGTALPAIALTNYSVIGDALLNTIAATTANVVGVTAVTAADTVAATSFTDATTFTSDNSSGAVTITGLTAAQTAVKKAGAGAFSPQYGATVASGTIEINGGSTGGAVVTTGAALVAATINSTGAANTIGVLTGAATATSTTINATTALTTGAATNLGATVTVNGAGNVSFGATQLEAGVTTLNAAGLTGTLTAVLPGNATLRATGGSGNDTITTGFVLTTGSVDAGAGTGDVLVVGSNVSHVNTTSLASKYTNFEILRVQGTMDMDLFPAFTAVQLSGSTNSITNLTAVEAAAITARADIGNTTLTLKTSTGLSDVLNIAFASTTATTNALSSGVITATGFEIINLTTTPGASIAGGTNRVTTVTGAIADTSLNNVNLNGSSYTFTDITSTKAVTWNASALTGSGAATSVGLTVASTSGSFAGSIITGSAFRDSVTMETTTGLTMNLGAGNDIVSTTTTLLLPSGATTDNTINGGDGTDRLIFTGAATATDTAFTKVTSFEQLELAGGAVDNSVTGLAAGFNNAFATGVSVTDTATQANAQAFTWSSGLYSGNVTMVHTTDATGATLTSNQDITTGAGNDNITLAAANWTGGSSASVLSVSTGAGNDTISVTTGTLVTTHITTNGIVVNPGTGQDAITLVHVNGTSATTLLANARIVLDAGTSSITAFDTITGFLKADGTRVSDSLDFTNATIGTYAATTATGYTSAQLTVAVANTGLVTFAGTSAAALTVADKILAVQSVVVTANGDTAFFIDNGSTYVFNNETAGDVVVQLIAQTGATALLTTNAVTNLGIHIM